MTVGCATLWVGGPIGPVERACLRSILQQGHRLALYCYGEPEGAPEGVEVRDAAEILSERLVFRHRGGSVAFFSDWFRYELLRRGLGTWVDTDVYLLAPLDSKRPYLFGEQRPGLVNNAILRLPPDSPMLPELLAPFEQRTTPRWLPWPSYIASRVRELATGRADLSRLPWGSTGPQALTSVARSHGLIPQALPPDVFYPAPWEKAEWIRDPSIGLEDMVTERTVALHLWNECIKGFKNEPVPDGCFLDRLQKEGQADPS